jgi:hypothetical protein
VDTKRRTAKIILKGCDQLWEPSKEDIVYSVLIILLYITCMMSLVTRTIRYNLIWYYISTIPSISILCFLKEINGDKANVPGIIDFKFDDGVIELMFLFPLFNESGFGRNSVIYAKEVTQPDVLNDNIPIDSTRGSIGILSTSVYPDSSQVGGRGCRWPLAIKRLRRHFFVIENKMETTLVSNNRSPV